MNIQSAVKEASIVLKNNNIKTAELDTEILLAGVLGLKPLPTKFLYLIQLF